MTNARDWRSMFQKKKKLLKKGGKNRKKYIYIFKIKRVNGEKESLTGREWRERERESVVRRDFLSLLWRSIVYFFSFFYPLSHKLYMSTICTREWESDNEWICLFFVFVFNLRWRKSELLRIVNACKKKKKSISFEWWQARPRQTMVCRREREKIRR